MGDYLAVRAAKSKQAGTAARKNQGVVGGRAKKGIDTEEWDPFAEPALFTFHQFEKMREDAEGLKKEWQDKKDGEEEKKRREREKAERGVQKKHDEKWKGTRFEGKTRHAHKEGVTDHAGGNFKKAKAKREKKSGWLGEFPG